MIDYYDNRTVSVSVSSTTNVCGTNVTDESVNNTCPTVVPIVILDEYVFANFTQPGVKFYSYTVPVLASYVEFSLDTQSLDVETWARWRAPPSHLNNDASATLGSKDKLVRFNSPRPGLWIFGVKSVGVDYVGLKLRVGTCPNGVAGPSCDIPYGEAVDNLNLSAVSNVYQYWKGSCRSLYV
eukprot:TRINITY_DN7426_c1_g1_i6.p1 TRINITY_DN7426_c1_g1~~TRINITY_DN7426_c1_g1_i6.p1  ORF type:complete len:182 (+),score=24.31 TRINITY_DN7426_c1_g1_i6:579-1124(+)